MITLRPYQVAAIDRLRTVINGGMRRVVLTAPTGAGKTVMFSEIIRSATALGRRSIVLAHRKELIDQTVEKLAQFGVQAGVIMANDRRRDDWLPVQVVSIQTLARRLDRRPPADLIVYDEAHHSVSQTSRKILEAYPDAVILGATATPWRTDRVGLADFFEDSVLAATPAELIEQGALVGYDAFAYDAPDLHSIRITAGDFNQKDLGLACNTDVLVGSIVREYLEHALGRRAIVFPVNVEHSERLAGEFRSAGITAEHVDSHTPAEQRSAAMERFRGGDLTVISSVGVLTEGFDAPAAEVCILARPTKSLTLHLQMIGRVLRPHTGKTRALIHDHAGNLLRHGLVEDERDYSLTATPQRVRELHTCPFCKNIFGKTRPDGSCPNCSQLIAPLCQLCTKAPCACPKAATERKEKLLVNGRRIGIEEIRARRAGQGLRDLTDGQLVKVTTASRRDMAAEYLRLCQVAERKGFKPGFVAHSFRDIFGHWPRFTDEELRGIAPARFPIIPPPRRAA